MKEESERIEEKKSEIEERIEMMRRIMERIEKKDWMREGNGRIEWVNMEYEKEVDMENERKVISEGREILGEKERKRMERESFEENVVKEKMKEVVNGERRVLEVIDVREE